ncbi:uncharacterized protein [Ptychodera flava]|uniref:uncharacterized protein n=1 Tax=Ptychodera flava TaxID=63121 RepID=UPI00396A0C28
MIALLFAVLFSLTSSDQGVVNLSESRLAVIDNRIQESSYPTLVFLGADTLKLQYRLQDGTWSKWISLASPPGLRLISNPATTHGHKNQIQVFVQASDGQIWYIEQRLVSTVAKPTFKEWRQLSKRSALPFESGVSIRSKDTVTVGHFRDQIVVFARSVSQNSSNLFWSRGNRTSGEFTDWAEIGGNANLASDASVVFNRFSGYFEAFAVMEDGKPYRTWQKDDHRWAGWRKHGMFDPSAVKTSLPAAHSMGHSFFNDALEVFILGTDGHVHHIYQTTCDKVDNPWGYCTWGVWSKLGNSPPVGNEVNALTAGNNIHHGIELFTIDINGSLWHTWQLEKGSKWNNWQKVGKPSTGAIATLPCVVNDEDQWWKVYVLDSAYNVAVVEQPRSLRLSSSSVKFGSNLTVSWSVPRDEATNKDWIGIYPHSANNNRYVDYRYVQGTLNPKKDPIPVGKATMQSFLPDGKYDVRYLVNRQYVSVMEAVVEYSNGSKEAEWVQLYKGLAVGLGTKNTNLVKCVQDGNETVQAFHHSFDAFENREVYHGLQLLGQALMDVQKTLETCLETDIAKAIEKFIGDLIKCTKSDCLDFTIDILEELLIILYEDIYEIFGDIHAASNSFRLIKAYEQGGLCIGRVVQACISSPL